MGIEFRSKIGNISSTWQAIVLAITVFILAYCCGSLLVQSDITAAEVQFSWDANTEENLDGYMLYHGIESGVYKQVDYTGKVTTYKRTFAGGAKGQEYYAALTAYNSQQESEFSKEISFVVPPDSPAPPGGFKFELTGPLSREDAAKVLKIVIPKG